MYNPAEREAKRLPGSIIIPNDFNRMFAISVYTMCSVYRKKSIYFMCTSKAWQFSKQHIAPLYFNYKTVHLHKKKNQQKNNTYMIILQRK